MPKKHFRNDDIVITVKFYILVFIIETLPDTCVKTYAALLIFLN